MKFILFSGVLIFSALYSESLQGQEVYRQFKTIEHLERMESLHPEVHFNRVEIEKFTNENIKDIALPEQGVLIPIAVHSIFNKKEERVTLEQVLSQIDALNRDFSTSPLLSLDASKISNESQSLVGVSSIQFCLAAIAGNSNRESAIIYKRTNRAEWTIDDAMKSTAQGGSDGMEVANVLNVWVVNLENGNSGYAQMPGGMPETDGVVIDYNFFGINYNQNNAYNKGKTLTHLVANYLNLFPLWSRGLCQDDFVSDTPIHNGPNFGCPSSGEISTCYKDLRKELTVNFMDNSDDNCMLMFTTGQINRMHTLLIPGGARYGLVSGNTLCSPPRMLAEPLTSSIRDGQLDVDIFPNPGNEELYIDFKNVQNQSLELIVTDLSGGFLSRRYGFEFIKHRERLEIRDWPNGLYLFNFYYKGQVRISKKVIIVH